jgi:hypothetical protein
MADYLKRIFVRAIKTRMKNEEKTLDEILETYTKLSEEDKEEIRKEFEV